MRAPSRYTRRRDRSAQRVEAPVPRPQHSGCLSKQRSLASAKPRRMCRGCPSMHWRGRSAKSLRRSCHRRPRTCWQTGSRQRRDGLGSASLSASSTREHRLVYSRSATQRDSHPSSPLGRQQRSGDSDQTIRRDLRLWIAAPAPKQIISRTDRPPSVDQTSASGPAVYCHTLVPVATSMAVSRL